MKKSNRAIGLFILAVQMFVFNVNAEVSSSSVSTAKTKSAQLEAAATNLNTTRLQNTKKRGSKDSNYDYGFSLDYELSTDYASQMSPQAYGQAFQVTAALNAFKSFDFSMKAGFAYTTIGTTIPEDSIEATDIGLRARYSHRLSPIFVLRTGLGASLPTSDSAKLNGYQAIQSGFVSIDSRVIRGVYNIIGKVGAGYIFNRYEFSPASTIANQDYYSQVEIINAFRIRPDLSFDIQVGARMSHALDGVSTLRFENQESLNYKLNKWQISLNYSNGSYIDQTSIDLWFVDKYRQLISLGVAYEI